jgi:hypothetical protein
MKDLLDLALGSMTPARRNWLKNHVAVGVVNLGSGSVARYRKLWPDRNKYRPDEEDRKHAEERMASRSPLK